MIRASAPYTSGWGSFVLLKMDRVRVARGGSLSTLHGEANPLVWAKKPIIWQGFHQQCMKIKIFYRER